MSDWWPDLKAEWSWSDPMLLVGLATLAFTALIPVLLGWLGNKQKKLDSELKTLQTETLGRQEQVIRRQRRDSLLETVGQSDDATHLGLLWREVDEYEGTDKRLLLAAFRANVSLALPGTSTGVRVSDDLSDEAAVSDYVDGFERRYAQPARSHEPYPGLLDFVKAVSRMKNGVKIETSKIAVLVTGPTSKIQCPGNLFFRDLVAVLPDSAGYLLNQIDGIAPGSPGGLRLNVLTGTLQRINAVIDDEIGRPVGYSKPQPGTSEALRKEVFGPLSDLLWREELRSLTQWSRENTNYSVSKPVADLIRVVGWLADFDDKQNSDGRQMKRMVSELVYVINAIAQEHRGGWSDAPAVRGGWSGLERDNRNCGIPTERAWNRLPRASGLGGRAIAETSEACWSVPVPGDKGLTSTAMQRDGRYETYPGARRPRCLADRALAGWSPRERADPRGSASAP